MKGINEFLSSDEEQSSWHRGIRKGLNYTRPKQVLEDYREYESFEEWENDEEHYEDIAMTLAYGFKSAVLYIGYKAQRIKGRGER